MDFQTVSWQRCKDVWQGTKPAQAITYPASPLARTSLDHFTRTIDRNSVEKFSDLTLEIVVVQITKTLVL
jgi:hypothetical protein